MQPEEEKMIMYQNSIIPLPKYIALKREEKSQPKWLYAKYFFDLFIC